MRFLAFLIILLVSTACTSLVPATTPPQLEATAGIPILIDDETIDAGSFSLNYPDGWRVVKLSLAGEPITLALVAPDDEKIWIKVSERAFEVPEETIDPNYYERFNSVEGNGKIIYLWGQFPSEIREGYDSIFESVSNSIQLP